MPHLRTRYPPEDGALTARTLLVVSLLCFFVAAAISYPAITRGDIYDNASVMLHSTSAWSRVCRLLKWRDHTATAW